MAADAGRLGERAPHARGRDELILRPVAAENLAHFKQRDIGEAAVGVLLRAGDQAGQQARPHVGEVGRDRIGERQLRLAAAEQLRLRLGDERPRHRLDHAARGERALGLAGAHLHGREDRLARIGAAVERRRRHAVDADDAHDLLDDVGLAVDVRPPRRHGDLHVLVLPGDHEAEPVEHAAHFRERHVEAAEALQLRQREIDHQLRHLRIAGDRDLGRRAAAEVEHHLRREFEPGHQEGRIDAALEAVARVRIDAELAAGLRDVERLPQRRLDQHVGGVLVAAGGFAAHDAGERFRPGVVGDHAHGVVERVGLAVEREQLLARLARAAPRDCPSPWRRRTHAAGGRGRR